MLNKSARYDYKFEDAQEQKIYDTPTPYNRSKTDLDVDLGEGDINIATSIQNSSGVFRAQNASGGRPPAKTQDNFNKNSLNNTPAIYHRSLYSNPNDLNHELWKQNFESLKTNYLKVMSKVNQENKAINQFKFDDDSDEESKQLKQKIDPKILNPIKNDEVLPPPEHQSSTNQYEKYRQTFKDENPADQSSDNDDDRFNEFEPSMGLEKHNLVSIFKSQ